MRLYNSVAPKLMCVLRRRLCNFSFAVIAIAAENGWYKAVTAKLNKKESYLRLATDCGLVARADC